ncbi:MAG: PfkB family carbohydrate kinase [Nitratireductor sp.]
MTCEAGAVITAGVMVFAAEPSRSATFRAFELASRASVPIIFDVDYRPYSWPSAEIASQVLSHAAGHCDMIVGNDEEFGFMAGSLEQGSMARALGESAGRIVIYKMGPKGAITFADGREIHTGIYEVDALKPTGAGDSFMAGLLASLAAGHIETALLRGRLCCDHRNTARCAPAMPMRRMNEAGFASRSRPTKGSLMHIPPHDNANRPIVDVDDKLVRTISTSSSEEGRGLQPPGAALRDLHRAGYRHDRCEYRGICRQSAARRYVWDGEPKVFMCHPVRRRNLSAPPTMRKYS